MRFLFALLLSLLTVSVAGDAAARSRIEWTKVEVREGDDAKRVGRSLRQMLVKATRRAKWGKKAGHVKLEAKVTRLEWEQRGDDVVRLNVTVVARVAGGQRARSHIRVGGSPGKRRKLEQQALRIVASGLVTRLAEMVRRRQ